MEHLSQELQSVAEAADRSKSQLRLSSRYKQ